MISGYISNFGWFKVNTDASISSFNFMMIVKRVARDHDGRWI